MDLLKGKIVTMKKLCVDVTEVCICKRFGYVDFSTDKVSKKALKLNGTEFAGRNIKIDMANNTPQRQNFGGRGRGGTPRGGILIKLFIESAQ